MTPIIKEFLAKYDVPQPVDPLREKLSDGPTQVRAFRFQHRDAAEFVMLVKNFYQVGQAMNEKTQVEWGPILLDPQTQTVVVQDHFMSDKLQKFKLQKFVAAYDTPPGTNHYEFQNLNEFLMKNPGSKAISYSLKNYSAEPLCHLFRSMFVTMENPEQVIPVAFFIDETSRKLTVATSLPNEIIERANEADKKMMVDAISKYHSFIAKFVELCDAGPGH